MSDNNTDDTDTSVLEDVDTEELIEGTQLEDAVAEDDENLGESIGRALGAIIGKRIGELIGRRATERISGGDEETHELAISIENEGGDPVQGATVAVEDEDSGLVGGLIEGRERGETDDDGEVTFALEDGEYTIEADAEDDSTTEDVTIEGDEEASLTIKEGDGEDDEGEDETGEGDEEKADEDGGDEESEDEEDGNGNGDENGEGDEAEDRDE